MNKSYIAYVDKAIKLPPLLIFLFVYQEKQDFSLKIQVGLD